MRRVVRDQGFTLIELLIVVAIIGLLAAMLIPNMIDALQKAKQKKTLADCRIIGGAMMAWLTDQVGAAAAGATVTVDMTAYTSIDRPTLLTTLTPTYLATIPQLDGWKIPYDTYLNTANPRVRTVMAIRSSGRDATFEGSSYVAGPFESTDYDRDIVWTDGYFVRWPQKVST